MTVAVFVEAVDTIRTLGWALVAWIVLLAVATTLAAYTVVAAVAWPCTTARDALGGALGGALAASRAVRALPAAQQAHKAAPARTAPSWAQTEQDAA